MDTSLQIAIEDLYRVFAKYPFRSAIDGCPCCVSDTDRATLHTKQLRELEEEDISRYAFKAISTWGDVDDFKHYLPRIFELSATTNFVVDTFVILGKLEYAGWKDWEDDEIKSVRIFLLEWWSHHVKTSSYFDNEILIEINKLIENVDLLLERWEISFENNSFRNFVDFVTNDFHELVQHSGTYKDVNATDSKKIIDWVLANKPILEEGFFHYETIDAEFSEQVSNTLYTLDRTPVEN